MQKVVVIAAILALGTAGAMAQTDASTSAPRDSLSMDQQRKIGEIITKSESTGPAAGSLTLAIGNSVPAEIELRPLPGPAAQLAPQLQGYSYVMVEEQIALVDPHARKIVTVIPRWRSQDSDSERKTTGSGDGKAR